MKAKEIVSVLSLVLLMSLTALADVPDEITYQGRLLYNGNPVTSATSVVFRLFPASSGGSAVWAETHGSVTPDSNGIYTEVLGTTVAVPDDYDALWLELVVAGNVLTPRKKLTSAPFVLRAGELPALYVSGNVGVGTTSPGAKLDIQASEPSSTHFLVHNGTPSSSSTSVWFRDTDTSPHTTFRVTGDYDADDGGPFEFGIDQSGKVGIGTTVPANKLHITDTNPGNETVPLLLNNRSSINNTAVSLGFAAIGNDTVVSRITSKRIGSGDWHLIFSNWDGASLAERMTIDKDGNVGIGMTPISGAKLQVNGDIKVPMVNQSCIYGASPGNPTCSCPDGYYPIHCGTNHYDPMTLQIVGTGCYAETGAGYTDSVSALVVRCAKIHE